jgi:hypothetical protein
MSSDTNAPAPADLDRSRENWLRRAGAIFRTWIEEVSGIIVPDFHVSMGFPGTSYERGVLAACHPGANSSDGKCHILIAPTADDTADILVSLLHEMIHVALYEAGDENWRGHRGTFAEYAGRLGLTRPYTESPPDVITAAQMMVMAHELGDFPHAKLTVRAPKPVAAPDGQLVSVGSVLVGTGGVQTNRWISFQCPTHKRSTRMSATAAAEGAPYCGHRDEAGLPCLTEMVAK